MTPFGAYCRQLRIRKSVSLKTQATSLSVSPSYLSSLEHGKRGKPSDEMVREIADFFALSTKEREELSEAARVSSTTVKIPQDSTVQLYKVMNMLAEQATRLSKADLNIIEVVLENKAQGDNCMKL